MSTRLKRSTLSIYNGILVALADPKNLGSDGWVQLNKLIQCTDVSNPSDLANKCETLMEKGLVEGRQDSTRFRYFKITEIGNALRRDIDRYAAELNDFGLRI